MSRQGTVIDKVNRLEGEDGEDDDLDIVKAVAKDVIDLDSFLEDISGVSDGSTTFDEDDSNQAVSKSKPKPNTYEQRDSSTRQIGERLTWSSEEEPDDARRAQAMRKSLKRKRSTVNTGKSEDASRPSEIVTGGKRQLSSSSVVGKRPRKSQTKAVRTFKRNRDTGRRNINKDGSDFNSDEELMDENMPDYLKDRKTEFDRARERLGSSGLKLPPSYEDVYFSDDDRLEELRERPVFPNAKPGAPFKDIVLEYSAGIIPAAIAQWLRDYQVKGAEFLHELFVHQRGGILGDDMGLGKTIQVIAFLTAAFGKTGDERDRKRMRKIRRASDDGWYPRVLIICPGSLMANWRAELERWGWWQVYTYHNDAGDKDAALQAASSGRAEIVITAYTTYRINMSALNTIDWDCVIADECHYIKGRKADITRAMNDINALCRIGLTGTAIQNNYDELWTLLNWTNPGRFGSLATWKSCIGTPLRIGQSHDATMSELAMARKTADKLVHNLLPQFFLRRVKALIADQLPKKSDRVVFCPLTETQADAYQNYVDHEIISYIRTSTDPCDCGSKKKRGWCCYRDCPGHGPWQSLVFPCIITLQKLANHAALLIPSGNDTKEKQEKDLTNLMISMPDDWKDLYRYKDGLSNYANKEFCGKWNILRKLLRFWHSNGDKVLIFSHSVRLLKMLYYLFTTTTSYNVSYLDGSMAYKDRSDTVDDFNANSEQFVFLISTKTGGVGLNITSANKVVVVDPNWNPSFDLQAQDRAYRIGQTRDVEVFRLVSAGTIEEIVYARQIYKQQQANIGYNASSERRYFTGVQDQKEKKGEIFGLKNLFTYQGDNIVLREIVNKTNVAESKAGVMVAGADFDAIDDDDYDEAALDGENPSGSNEEREDAAMSQLAALIKRGGESNHKIANSGVSRTKKKMDAVQAILASAGVKYTHENSEVIGTSKVESRLSRRAMEHSTDLEVNNETVFAPESQTGEAILRIPQLGNVSSNDGPDSIVTRSILEEKDEFKALRYKHRPPRDVQSRQFCTMAKMFGFSDATDFALVVEGWTQEQRRNCLDKFYRIRRNEILVPEAQDKI